MGLIRSLASILASIKERDRLLHENTALMRENTEQMRQILETLQEPDRS